MDFLRSVLLIGLVVMVWKFRYRGTRPIKEFLLWGVHYPLPFGLFVFMTLIVWGLIGQEFGLYTLFFEDNGFIQALLGVATMLLFQGLLFHFLALDGTKSRWSSTVRTTLDVLLQLSFLGRKQPWAVLAKRLPGGPEPSGHEAARARAINVAERGPGPSDGRSICSAIRSNAPDRRPE